MGRNSSPYSPSQAAEPLQGCDRTRQDGRSGSVSSRVFVLLFGYTWLGSIIPLHMAISRGIGGFSANIRHYNQNRRNRKISLHSAFSGLMRPVGRLELSNSGGALPADDVDSLHLVRLGVSVFLQRPITY